MNIFNFEFLNKINELREVVNESTIESLGLFSDLFEPDKYKIIDQLRKANIDGDIYIRELVNPNTKSGIKVPMIGIPMRVFDTAGASIIDLSDVLNNLDWVFDHGELNTGISSDKYIKSIDQLNARVTRSKGISGVIYYRPRKLDQIKGRKLIKLPDYILHITDKSRLSRILKEGLKPGKPMNARMNYENLLHFAISRSIDYISEPTDNGFRTSLDVKNPVLLKVGPMSAFHGSFYLDPDGEGMGIITNYPIPKELIEVIPNSDVKDIIRNIPIVSYNTAEIKVKL